MTLTLAEAAEYLQIDTKTLTRKLARAGITPASSPLDRRMKLLAEEQVHQLLIMSGQSPELGMHRSELKQGRDDLGDQVQTLKRRVTALEEQVRVLHIALLGLAQRMPESRIDLFAENDASEGGALSGD